MLFMIYKHTNYPPTSKSARGPWATFTSWLGNLGLGNFGASNDPSPATGLGLPGEPSLPHRILYYKASFDIDTTVQQVRGKRERGGEGGREPLQVMFCLSIHPARCVSAYRRCCTVSQRI